ncbi:MAG TPA: DUF3467 domain-containing protein [Stellaceae bacterium]|nr:DUF3467 domain-containing protein [Stellaceae bacterium]
MVETNTGPKAAAAPEHLRWDIAAMRSHRCTLATASATRDEVILNFGARTGQDHPGGEVAVELLQRVVLSPATAKHLMATLQRLLAADSPARPPL